MAITVSFRGVNYIVPEPTDANTQSLTDYLNAISTGAVPFPTTADIDLGSAFGLKSLYYKGRAANPAASGLVRLSLADLIAWRNNANNADLLLGVGAQDQLQWRGSDLSGNPMLGANTAAAQSIPNTGVATIVVFGTVELDTDSGYNAGTGRYTVPTGKGGHYEVVGGIAWNTAATSAFVQIFKNAAALKVLASSGTGGIVAATGTQGGSCVLNLAAGDIIDFRAAHSSAGAVVLTGVATNNYLAIKRIPA